MHGRHYRDFQFLCNTVCDKPMRRKRLAVHDVEGRFLMEPFECRNRSPAQWLSVKYAYKDARRYAERQGYILKGTEKIWDSSLVNMGITWVAEHAPERLKHYFDAVYPPFWRRELDIENVNVVIDCLGTAGVKTEGFAAYAYGHGRQQHDTLQAQLHDAGIYGVPTYVFDDKILFGREHLPFVRWSLTGKQGPPPDMAYSL